MKARDCVSGRCGAGKCEEHPYFVGDPVPPGYRIEISQSDGAATARFAGLLFLVGGYAPAYIGALSMPSEYGALYIPLAGPWITMGVVEATPDKVFLAIDGAAQAAGAVLLVGGMVGAGRSPKAN